MNLDHLDQLDDPERFVPDDAFRAGALRRGRRLRRRQRLTLVVGSTLATLLLVVGVTAGYAAVRVSQIDRTEVDFTTAPPVALDEPFNLLVVGSDHRADAPSGDQRSDTMIVVRILPAERVVRVLSLPRDLVVEPASGGPPQRLTTLITTGGVQALVDTVQKRLGVPVNGFVAVNFEGLMALVDAAGGLEVGVPAEIRDEPTGLHLEAASCTTLDGAATLQLVRSRHLEVRSADGVWVSDPTSDLGRMQRQRDVLSIALPQVAAAIDDPIDLNRLVGIAAEHLSLDSRLGVAELVDLGQWLLDGPLPQVEQVEVPVVPAKSGQAAVLVLGDGAGGAIAAIGGTLPEVSWPDGLVPDGDGVAYPAASAGMPADATVTACP
jgi:LCP family protein required for cell wall assembly